MLIGVLANLVEFRNGESGQHVLHIQTITELLLNSLLLHTDQYSISERDRWLICTASALHDMGKIMIPGSILNKPGRLTTEEFEIMKTHAAEGAKILDQIPMREREPLLQFAYQICRWHHERYDGRGYPDGLQGDQIPIAAQVVALADVYDALTSERVYKPAYSPEKAVQMILNGECGAFNPILLECLVDSADNLKKAITNSSLEKNSEQEILKTVEQMLRENQLHTSERSFRLLERERMKFQFLSELSQEITFEYTAAPEMVTLSRWGAGYLEMPEIMLNPRDSAFGTQLFQPAEFDHLVHSLVNTTQEEPTVEEVYLLNIRGEKRWCKVVARTIWLSEENVHFESAIGKITDVHDEMERMRRLERLAQSDPLTGLLNHDAARRRIESFLNQQGNEQYVLMFFDLDNFKQANDTRGHLFGNAVLKYVASVVKDHVRGEDTVARVGGDEFVVFMKYQGDPTALVERVFQAVSINYQDFQIRVSMGVALADAPGYNYKQLYQQADTAMYTIKNSSKNGYCFYTPAMKQQD
jgi:putative two-component system response regulator